MNNNIRTGVITLINDRSAEICLKCGKNITKEAHEKNCPYDNNKRGGYI